MVINNISPTTPLSLFVKNIMTIESDVEELSKLPFYADGYPGIMYQKTQNGLFVIPQNKKMPDFFLYGQTIHPIELKIEGKFKFIVFQLYPFVINSFFEINPQSLNDDCYNLQQIKNANIEKIITGLSSTKNLEEWNNIISGFLLNIFEQHKIKLDDAVQNAVLKIIANNGQQTIRQLSTELFVTERTLERRFLAQVGITAKQFSKIIQFQNSLEDIQDKEFNKLTEVVFNNGFADQSHFIRVFKSFTGKTPTSFISNK